MRAFYVSGYVGNDPELKITGTGKKVLTLNVGQKIAANRSQFVRVTCWDRNAEYCEKFVRKGSYVSIEGNIVVNKREISGKNYEEIALWGERVECPKQNNTGPFYPESKAPEGYGYGRQPVDPMYGADDSFEITADDLPY